MAEIRQATILIRDRQVSGGALPSTALMAEPFVNLHDGVLRFSGVTGGGFEPSSVSSVFEVGSTLYNSKITNRLNINDNFIISGGTGLISTYGGASGAGLDGKFMSGTTNGFVLGDISDIQGITDITRVQPGTNITTGGTANTPIINLVDSPSINGLTASGTSNFTGVIQSGGTNLSDIFLTSGDLSGTSVSAGANVSVNNVGTDYEVSVVDSPSFNDITFSGTATGGDASFADMSATTLYSGSTDLETIISNIAGTHDSTRVQGGTNISTGGTANEPIINLDSDIVLTSVNATSISGDTLYSGSTDLYDIFATQDTTDITRVQPGTNVSTGGTGNFPIVNVVDSPSFNNVTFSGAANGGTIDVTSLSANSISATTEIYSGGTSLEDIITNLAGTHTTVSAGSNISVGGTAENPIVSLVDSPVVNQITASGLTNTRVVFAGAGGLLSDDAGMTYNSGTDVLTVNGNLTTNGTQYSGGTIVDDGIFTIDAATQVEVDSDLLPSAHLTYDLGAVGQRWDEVYARRVRLGTSSTMLEDSYFSSSTGTFLFDFADDLIIDNTVRPNVDTNYDLGEVGTRWKTIYAQDLDLSGALTTTGLTDSSLTAGRVVYVGAGGSLTDEAGFEYDAGADLLKATNLQIGTPGTTGLTTLYGDLLVMGEGISGFTSELYIEDNLIELNYNPTASTESTSLGAGWSIQDGSGTPGIDVLFDIRGTATGVANRSFATNLNDIRIRETGTIASPNGVRVIAETDIIDGGSY